MPGLRLRIQNTRKPMPRTVGMKTRPRLFRDGVNQRQHLRGITDVWGTARRQAVRLRQTVGIFNSASHFHPNRDSSRQWPAGLSPGSARGQRNPPIGVSAGFHSEVRIVCSRLQKLPTGQLLSWPRNHRSRCSRTRNEPQIPYLKTVKVPFTAAAMIGTRRALKVSRSRRKALSQIIVG
jgi:hypothetical protein